MQHLPARPDIVVLTHGWTGSSVFAALLGQAGYWLGGETMQKPDYDTFENAELVALNKRLCTSLAPALNHEHRFDANDVLAMEHAAAGMDLQPYRDFVARCSAHGPWLWKDPRLTWTIRVWAQALDLRRLRFLVLTREPLQAWISANTRRHVQSPRFTREYNQGITRSNLRFLEERELPYMQASFEDLLLAPERTLERLDACFGTSLTMAALGQVCREPLGRKSRGWKDLLLASLIYARNFDERDGRGRPAPAPATASLV